MKKRYKKTPAKKEYQKQQGEKSSFKLPTINDLSSPASITVLDHLTALIALILVSSVWLYCSWILFPTDKGMLGAFLIGMIYFFGAVFLYIVRAILESKRRYGYFSKKTVLYYTQMIKGDQKWSLYIGMSFFALLMVLRWLFPSPNFNMVGIDIATSFYLGYIWSAKYKGEEELPYEYMETIFLLFTVVTNYIVYFFNK